MPVARVGHGTVPRGAAIPWLPRGLGDGRSGGTTLRGLGQLTGALKRRTVILGAAALLALGSPAAALAADWRAQAAQPELVLLRRR